MDRMVVDSAFLVGQRVVSITIGWHELGSIRKPVRYFLHLADRSSIEIHPAGDGSIELVRESVPPNFDMEQYGALDFREVDGTNAIATPPGRSRSPQSRASCGAARSSGAGSE
jgi:hypothetical protein